MSKPLKLKEFRALMRLAGYTVRWYRVEDRFRVTLIDGYEVVVSYRKPQVLTIEWVDNMLLALEDYRALMRRAGYQV